MAAFCFSSTQEFATGCEDCQVTHVRSHVGLARRRLKDCRIRSRMRRTERQGRDCWEAQEVRQLPERRTTAPAAQLLSLSCMQMALHGQDAQIRNCMRFGFGLVALSAGKRHCRHSGNLRLSGFRALGTRLQTTRQTLQPATDILFEPEAVCKDNFRYGVDGRKRAEREKVAWLE